MKTIIKTRVFREDLLQGEYLSGGRRRRPKREVGADDRDGDEDVGTGDCGDGTAGGADVRDGSGRLVEEECEGTGADIAGKKHGFNRSTETVQGLPPRSNTNVFSFFCLSLIHI